MSKRLEDYLSEVNYHDYSSYIPTNFALRVINFIKLCTDGRGEEHQTPIIHYMMLDKYASRKVFNLNICARGLAKSALNRYLMLYLAVYGKIDNFGEVTYALYVADSEENNVKSMRQALELTYENSEFLHKCFKKVSFTDVEWKFETIEGRRFVVTGHGAQGGIRGATRLNSRPQLALLDDLIKGAEDARSPTIMKAIENVVYQSVMFALHPTRRKVIWSGTPFHQGDPLYKAVASGAWNVSVFPVCEHFTKGMKKEDFKSAWKDRFDFESVNGTYDLLLSRGTIADFNQEMMLKVMSDEDRLILDDDILWYTRKYVVDNKQNYHFYITTDFATSEKESADYSVIFVWAYTANGDWLLVDGIAERQTMDMNIEALFLFVKKYSPLSVGVEISGQQQGFVAWLKQEMIKRNIFFNFARNENSSQDGLRPTTNKLVRFNTAVPLFKLKKIFLPKELKDVGYVKELVNELQYATSSGFKSAHDDCLDNISQLTLLNAVQPAESEAPQEKTIYDTYYNDAEETSYNHLGSKSVVF